MRNAVAAHSLLALVFALVGLGFPEIGQATTIFSDDFSDGSRLKTGASDLNWFNHNGLNPVLSVVDDSAGLGSGNALRNSPQALPGQGGLGQFTLTSLGVGQSIVLTFDARAESLGTASDSMRFGIFDSNGAVQTDGGAEVGGPPPGFTPVFGYTAGIHSAVAVSGAFGNTETLLGGSGSVTLDSGAFPAIDIDTQLGTSGKQLAMRVTRSAGFNTVSIFSDGLLIWQDTDSFILPTSFDTVAFHASNFGGTSPAYRVDNITVTVVPEPGSFVLLCTGLIGFARARGRRDVRRFL